MLEMTVFIILINVLNLVNGSDNVMMLVEVLFGSIDGK